MILFLPKEAFFSAALEQDPKLIEYGWQKKVALVGPTILLALLRLVEYGWHQRRFEENAQEILNEGKELYNRIKIFMGHFAESRSALDKAVNCYNDMIGSLKWRLLPAARKFKELGIPANEEVPPLEYIEAKPVELTVVEPEVKLTSGDSMDVARESWQESATIEDEGKPLHGPSGGEVR